MSDNFAAAFRGLGFPKLIIELLYYNKKSISIIISDPNEQQSMGNNVYYSILDNINYYLTFSTGSESNITFDQMDED